MGRELAGVQYPRPLALWLCWMWEIRYRSSNRAQVREEEALGGELFLLSEHRRSKQNDQVRNNSGLPTGSRNP